MGRLALVFFEPLWGLILFAGGIFFVLVVPALAISAFSLPASPLVQRANAESALASGRGFHSSE